MDVRSAKVMLMAGVALYVTLVAFNNITDYGSNFRFVRHVLMMDTTFPDNRARWRAVDSGYLHHAAYIAIILTEVFIAIVAWFAAWRMWGARGITGDFKDCKRYANTALVAGVLLWFGGFIGVGGEWFLMWQSESWNGVQSAYRIVSILLLVLIIVSLQD